MLRSSILSVIALCAAGLVSQSPASAQAKIGVIDLQRAITDTAEIKKAQNEMLAKYKVRQDTLEKAQRELSDIQTQLQASQGKLSAAGEADLQARGQRKQREAQRLSDDLQADVDRDRQDILNRVGTRMTDIVKKLSDEKGFDLIVEKAAAIAFKPTLEITNDAIAAYDKAFPASSMAGYLDAYGAGDEQRERRNKRLLLWGMTVIILGTVLFFTFRDWREERAVKQFLTLLEQKDYQGAYKLWGCTPDTPCKYYPPERFTEDFGPSSAFADPAAAKILHVDACGNGVVFNIAVKSGQELGLWVEKDTHVVSFAPWPRCPGRHLQVWEFIKSRFS